MKKNIVVGVCGGIACYKAVEIVNQLTKDGYNVNVIMTKSAVEFVKPLTFRTLSGNCVVTAMFDEVEKYTVKHVELAKSADLFLIVPATANIIAKIACGIADDMLSTTLLAACCPIVVAPAMNKFMYENSIVQENISKLKKHGFDVLGTDNGHLACGDIGEGKLLPWETIVSHVRGYFEK